MGYRSDVTIVFYPSAPANAGAVKLWFTENYPKADAVDEWDAQIEEHDDGTCVVRYESVKWHDGYSHPQAVMAALNKFREVFCSDDADETICLAHFEMAQVGEEITDIQTERTDYSEYRLDVHRTIHLN